MDGVAQISIINKEGGRDVRHLYFGCQAVEEFGRRIAENLSESGFKIATDMIYAGLQSYVTLTDQPAESLSYTEVYRLMEDFYNQEDFVEQYDKVQEVFWESKYGRDYKKRLEEFKKKAMESLSALTQETSGNTGTT